MRRTARLQAGAAAALALVLVAAAFWGGRNGPFLHDDHPALTANPAVQIQALDLPALWRAALGRHSGERPISMLTLGINHAGAGLAPRPYKLFNLAIHLLNTVLVAAFAFLLLGRTPGLRRERPALLAGVAALIWAIGPLQVSTVLYVVQRMTLLSALFTLAALCCYTLGRLRLRETGRNGWVWIALVVPLTALAVLSKETGVLVLPLCWLVEVVALAPPHPARPSRADRVFGWALLGLSAAGGLVLLAVVAPAQSFELKTFSAVERMLTEPRILWWYVWMTLLPQPAGMALIHDTWQVSTSLLQPPLTAVAIVAWLMVLGAAGYWRRRFPLFAFAVGWFAIGHSIEAGPLALELAYEHRNYLPGLGVVLLAAAPIGAWAQRNRAARAAAIAAGTVVVATLFVLTTFRSHDWGDATRLATAEARHHPDSPAAAIQLAMALGQDARAVREAGLRRERALVADREYLRAIELNPLVANPIFGRIRLRYDLGLPVPDALLADFVAVAARSPVRVTTFNAVMGFLQCASQRRCRIPEPWISRIVADAAAHEGYRNGWKAQVLAGGAEYYGTVGGNQPRAVALARQAVDVDSASPVMRLVLAKWLALSGERAAARAMLDEAQRLDPLGQHREYREQMRRALGQR